MTNLIKDLRRSRLTRQLCLEMALLALLIAAVPFHLNVNVLNAVGMALAACTFLVWAPMVWQGMRKPVADESEQLATGICKSMAGYAISAAMQIYALNFDGGWIYATPLLLGVRYIVVSAAMTHQVAAYAHNGDVPARPMLHLLAIVIVSGAAGAALALLPRWVAGA